MTANASKSVVFLDAALTSTSPAYRDFTVTILAGESLLWGTDFRGQFGDPALITSVVWDPAGVAQALTTLHANIQTGSATRRFIDVRALDNPTPKTSVVRVSFASATNVDNVGAICRQATNTDPAGMIGGSDKFVGNLGIGTPMDHAIPSAPGGMMVDFIFWRDDSTYMHADAGQSNVVQFPTPQLAFGSSTKPAGSGSTTNMRWTGDDTTAYDAAQVIVWLKSAPAAVPGAPTIGTASAGNGTVTISGTAPASDGGSAILNYTARLSPGALTATSATLPITVPGATNGVAYTGTLHATNAVGNSAESASSNSVTPSGTNVAPSFIGPNIANITGTPGVTITPVDVHTKFSDSDTLSYYASPAGTAWPSGLIINQTTGVISGAMAATAVSGLKVRAIDTATPPNSVDSNAFSVTVAAAGGAVTVQWPNPLKNINGGLRLGEACRVVLFDKATDALIGRQTGLTTNATTGYPPAFTMTGPVAGTQYRGVVIMDADGAEGIELVTPT